MKGWIILVCTVAFFLFIAVPQASLCAPRISIQNTEYDAGEIPQGKEISNEFVLKNIGTDPLTIKVRPC